MRVGLSADHGGFALKLQLMKNLEKAGHEVIDFGAFHMVEEDDYPDFVVPMAQAVARGEVERGLAVCGSGIGACVAANKISGVRAGVLGDSFSAHQGVEDDNINVGCLGGRVLGHELAWELTQLFINATFSGLERHQRRLAKVAALENKWDASGKL